MTTRTLLVGLFTILATSAGCQLSNIGSPGTQRGISSPVATRGADSTASQKTGMEFAERVAVGSTLEGTVKPDEPRYYRIEAAGRAKLRIAVAGQHIEKHKVTPLLTLTFLDEMGTNLGSETMMVTPMVLSSKEKVPMYDTFEFSQILRKDKSVYLRVGVGGFALPVHYKIEIR